MAQLKSQQGQFRVVWRLLFSRMKKRAALVLITRLKEPYIFKLSDKSSVRWNFKAVTHMGHMDLFAA